MPHRISQLVGEIVSTGTGGIRASDLCIEIVSSTAGSQPARISDLCVEIVSLSGGPEPSVATVVSQAGIVSVEATGSVEVTQFGAITISQEQGVSRITQVGAAIVQAGEKVRVTQTAAVLVYRMPTGEQPEPLPRSGRPLWELYSFRLRARREDTA